ncbi:helix-turn-helix domain-containing protein [Lutispora thermophila]|uniref:Transcriptional regulator, XRE family with cupin sensor n=1 Tax=Lutispora thermophila DSM 19022 TaxID=1122184 RepID=A0A1M6GX65_9FIRM|nr:XRE family transcriptional regulator [Lutispora thermophila]SHJ14522.1 transcriptional regulator, XRE family with cupin sensor [Lutispora thermophila DSM 19022]
MMNEISDKIKNLRKLKNMTLKDLSEKTGLSVSFLSQVENGASSLAITSLKKIADAFDVTINYFFEVPQVHNYLVKEEEKEVFKIEGSNSKFIRLSGDFPNRKLEAMITIIPPEQKHGSKFSHPGEEFVYVLEGIVIIEIDGKEYLVKAGDSIHYPSTCNHLWTNPLKQEAKLLTVMTPLIF